MDRSISPIHVHVGKKTPVHLHLTKKGLSKVERMEISCSEMSAGRPSLRATASTKRGSRWGDGSTSHSPWVPPPGKTTAANRMTWEGPTHRLDITPGPNGGRGENTVLRVSDLSDDGLTDIVVERESPLKDTLHSLRAEVDHLKTEVDLERSLRDLEETECSLRESRLSLREREEELVRAKEDLVERELENMRLSLDKMKKSPSVMRRPSSPDVKHRNRLSKKLIELEMDSATLCKQADTFREAVRKLQKDRRFLSVYAADVVEQKDRLLDQLAQFECSNKTLRKLLRAQQIQETNVGHLSEQKDVLMQQVSEADTTNQFLRSRLDESERMAMHSQALHDQVSHRDVEIQALNIRLQSLEEQLRAKEGECVMLESRLAETKRKSQLDKDLLKRATKQHKERAIESQASVGTLSTQLDLSNVELDELRRKVAQASRDEITRQSEIRSLRSKVKELKDTLDLSRTTSKSSVNAVSTRLLEKTQELNTVQMENDRLESMLSVMEGKIKAVEGTSRAKVSSLEAEVEQLQDSIRQYESLMVEYKGQLDSGRLEVEGSSRELKHKDEEVERAKHAGALELEKHKIIHQQQTSELESTKEQLKVTEIHLRDTQERLSSYEQRSIDQAQQIASLNTKLDQTTTSMDDVRDKWHESTGEKKTMVARLDVQERRIHETEQQNRELMEMVGKKEDDIRRLQGRVEELLHGVASASTHNELGKSEHRRQLEHVKDKAASKDRANLSRIADLESQLSRANGVSSQLRKSKEESDRRYKIKVGELQDRLEQANSTKRSMENYANFLKSSYASVFNDVGGSPPTSSHRNPLIH